MNRMLYHEWFPQIMYNHHQTGPTGTILFAPPFRDPANYVYHPLIITGLDVVGAAMHNRFVAENKPGATMRRGANYSTWWNGGLRTTVYFHNMIGLLTESIGNPTPIEVAFVPDRQIMSADLPFPIEPQTWHFRQSIEYSDHRQSRRARRRLAQQGALPLQHLQDGQGLHRGRIEGHLDDVSQADSGGEGRDREGTPAGARLDRPVAAVVTAARHTVPMDQYDKLMQRPEWRDARAYVLPSDQTDFLTATKFMNTLIKTGIQIHRATRAVQRRRQAVPGRFVRREDGAGVPRRTFSTCSSRRIIPTTSSIPGGPPIPPYDNAGWTLAYQMGVKFDRILENVDGQLVKLGA